MSAMTTASAQNFVGNAACAGCHASTYAEWSKSLHANLYRAPITANMISPWSGDVTLTDAGASLTLTLSLDDNGGAGPYSVALFADAAKTTPLMGGTTLTLVRAHGGKDIAKNINDGTLSRGGGVAGENEYMGKQRYHVAINGAEYILPAQWNVNTDLDGNNGGWVNYHLGDWITSDGTLKIEDNNAKASEARRCAGCHQTGIDSVTHDGSKYVLNGAGREENITCEACHGPGSDHTAGPSKTNIVNPSNLTPVQQVDLCGSCHSRGHSMATIDDGISTTTTFGYPYLTRTFRPGDVWSDLYVEAGGYWGNGVSAKQHHQQYEEFILSDHYADGLTCTDCHGMHGILTGGDSPFTYTYDPTFEHALRVPARGVGNTTLCASCHIGEGLTFTDEADVIAHTGHPVSAIAPDCTNCHMPAVAKSGVHYDIHSHTFEVLMPQTTIDNNMPNSCAILCHRGAGPEENGGTTDTLINTWNQDSDLSIANWLITASLSDGAPVVSDVTGTSNGLVATTWTNNGNNEPLQTLGFAYDLYAGDFVDNGAGDIWFNLSTAAGTDEMDLGLSGAYFVWVGNQYADGGWFPSDAATILLNTDNATPHTPLGVSATDGGSQVVTLTWTPEAYGTWLYWVIAYDGTNGEWATVNGPLGDSIWQYVLYGDADYTNGSVDLTVPAAGDYWFFIQGMAWDATTFSEFATPAGLTTVQ